ncbi:MAG: substrate-binding domain-containing protein [Sulfitobacter sp.]
MTRSIPMHDKFSSKTPLVAGTLAYLLAFAAPAFAQSENTVLLQSNDGSVSITGALVETDAEFFTINGQLGVMKVPRTGVECIGQACPSLEVAAPVVVENRAVSLHSKDDETRINGDLINVEGDFYILRNALGEFRIAVDNVTCVGNACPVAEVFDTDLAFYGASPKVNNLLVDLLRDYSTQMGQSLEFKVKEDATQSVQIFSGDDNELVADINLLVADPASALSALSERTADVLIYDEETIDRNIDAVAGLGTLLQNPLAFDGQVIVGHAQNPVRDLSLAEIDQIWKGDITSWRDLGAGNFPINIHMVEDAAGSAGWLYGLQAANTLGATIHKTESQVIEAVKADRNAVGLVHHAAANKEHSKMLAVRKSCGLTAEPTQFGLGSEHYPFTQPLKTYGRGDSIHPFAQSFLEWTLTDAATPSVSRWGYTSAGLQRTKIQDMGVAVVHTAAFEPDFDGGEFSTMMKELRTADRLSITFTFLTGSTVLDEVSLDAAKDLARRLKSAEFDGQEVLLVGFADNTGPAAPNSALSLRRAKTVRDALALEFDAATLGQLNLIDMGFGEQMPVDCNSTDSGRANNRRVEVWVRVKS